LHTAILRPNPRAPSPRRTGRRGRPACEIYWRTRIPALAEEIRRRVCRTLGVGVARVSPFQGWIGWGALFPGRCPGLSPLAALRPTPASLAHPTVLPRCGQHRPRWRTPPSCRVAANAGLVGATPPSCRVAANAGLVGAPHRLAALRPTPGPLVHLLRLAAFGHVSSYQRLHNDRPYPRAPTGRPAIARGNALGIAPPNQSSPERARFHAAILCPNPRTPSPRRTGRRGRPAYKIYWRTRIPALAEEIRRRVYGTLGVGVARVSPFQGWIGWGALFPGRCPGLSPLAALRPTPASLAHPTVLPRCGQHRPRWRTPPSCRVAANAGLVGATPPSCRVAANAGLVGAPHRLAALRPTPASLAQPLRLATLRLTPALLAQPHRLAVLRPTPGPLSTCSVLPRSDTCRRTRDCIMIAHTPAPQRGAMR